MNAILMTFMSASSDLLPDSIVDEVEDVHLRV